MNPPLIHPTSALEATLYPVFQDALRSVGVKLRGFELYKLVVPRLPHEELIPLVGLSDLAPCTRLFLVIPFEREGRVAEIHAKYHVNLNGGLTSEFFEVASSDIFPDEDVVKVEYEILPPQLKGVLADTISNLILNQ